jgi:Terminase large subunit, T4likevirus-type, N-terminal/Terminase RNaseH-like domain
MRIELPNPHVNQQVILDSSKRFRVVMCGRRFGKSELSQIEIIVNALQGKQVAYITPTYQLARVFFDRLTKAIPFENNKSELSIKFPNDGAVYFFTGERLDNLRGRKFHFIVIDEASFIPNLEEGWQNSIRPTLTDYKGRALFLSTPKGKNFFYSLFLKSGEPDWESFKFTTYDNPYIDRGEIDDARTQLPQVVFEQEYMANPAENASNPFGSSYIKQCTFELSHEPPIAFGVDLAKSVDWSVIIGLDKNGSVCHFERFQKDWRQTKQVIENLPRIPILIDSTGVGDPIFEDLQREGVLVTGFKFTSTSKQQLMEGLASAIQQRKITFPEGYITNELEVFEYQYTATGVRYSAPQGFHDDCVMALGLAWQHYTRNQAQGKYSFA